MSDSWGGWEIDPARPMLAFEGYEIDLTTCRDSAHVLDRIVQVAGKTWADDEVLAGLVRALDEILLLQSTICGGGEDHVLPEGGLLALVNGTRLLRREARQEARGPIEKTIDRMRDRDE